VNKSHTFIHVLFVCSRVLKSLEYRNFTKTPRMANSWVSSTPMHELYTTPSAGEQKNPVSSLQSIYRRNKLQRLLPYSSTLHIRWFKGGPPLVRSERRATETIAPPGRRAAGAQGCRDAGLPPNEQTNNFLMSTTIWLLGSTLCRNNEQNPSLASLGTRRIGLTLISIIKNHPQIIYWDWCGSF